MISACIAALCTAGVAVMIYFDPHTESQILLIAMAVLAWSFVAVYARQPWRQTQAGRSVMATTVALGLIGTQMASVWLFGDYPGSAEVRAVMLIALTATLLHRLLVLIKIRREERDHDFT
ncbi:hypothetical protein N505_0105445 [Rhodococcus aetherivorans]|nr:hypothetical protein N505_0105445 [Rhodococcus aetherivorans]